MILSAPDLLNEGHDVDSFVCDEPSLNEWLQKRALSNQGEGASRTFVVCEGAVVKAYYSLAAGSVENSLVPGRFRRNMPDPIPVVILGRLAVDRSVAGQGIGRALVRDAGLRISGAAATIGVRGVLVHPLSPNARSFYRAIGFIECPRDPSAMVITLKDLNEAC